MDLRNVTTLDWETYFDDEYSLKKMTTEAYVRDPRFETIGVAVRQTPDCERCGGGGFSGTRAHYDGVCDECGGQGSTGPVTRWLNPTEFKAWVEAQNWDQMDVLAHHAHFDLFILSHHYGKRPRRIYDSLSMARALHGTSVGGSLEKLALHYGVGVKGKELLNAKGKRYADFTPEEYAAFGDYAKNDVDLTWDIFRRMGEVFPQCEYEVIDRTVRMFTEPELVVDEALLEDFIKQEEQRKATLLQSIGATDRKVLLSDARFADLLRAQGVDPPTKTSPKTGKPIYAFAKSDPGMQDLLEHEDDTVRFLAEARVGVKSTINETRAGRLLDAGRRGPLPCYLNYCGAHTTRFSGGGKINLQNFPRGGTLRAALKAPPGHVVVAADSAQIEARMTAWFAGHTELVDAFRQKRDIYSELASKIYRRHVDRKKNKEDERPGFVGKTASLGLQYQMAWAKFSETMLRAGVVFTMADARNMQVDVEGFTRNDRTMRRVSEMASRLPFAERVVHCAVAAHVVKVYREENAPIPKLWDDCQNKLIPWMLEGEEVDIGPIRTTYHGFYLPNGLKIHYRGLHETEDGYVYIGGKGGKTPVRLYGGILTENIIQALARCVVIEQMCQLPYKVVTTTHDEIVMVAPEAEAEKVLEHAIEVMRTAPAWAPGLPLNAEGAFGSDYGKCK